MGRCAFTRVIVDYFQVNYHQYYSSVHTEHPLARFHNGLRNKNVFVLGSVGGLCVIVISLSTVSLFCVFDNGLEGGSWVKVVKLGVLEFLKKLHEEGFKFMERQHFF